jgi:hypothetical protein
MDHTGRVERPADTLRVQITPSACLREEQMAGLTFFQPNPGPDGPCPVCAMPRPSSTRYPQNVCADCVGRAEDGTGRRLRFFNTDLSGGFGAAYVDNGEARDSDGCFIDGRRCRAREARFGGIVVEPRPV